MSAGFEVEKIEYANKTFRMPAALIKELEQVAQQKEVSVNNLVQQCCRFALEHLSET